MKEHDTILCRDKEDAKSVLDSVGEANVKDWEFLENGKVRLILNCTIKELAERTQK